MKAVEVRSPEGKTAQIPEADLEWFLEKGWELASGAAPKKSKASENGAAKKNDKTKA